MIVFDESHLPIIYIVNTGEYVEADIESYYSHCRALLRRGEQFATLSDVRHIKIPNAYWRKRIAEMADELDGMMRNVTIASAAVLGSSIMVGAARAVQWLRRRDVTPFYSRTAAEAFDHLARACEREGLIVPPSARQCALDLDRAHREGTDPISALRAPS
jgi:hypothetical protein